MTCAASSPTTPGNVLLARALATGKGYTLTNLPTPGIAPVYPSGFPLLLSLVFRMAPGFPGNVVLLKAVSIASMGAVAGLTIRYCCRDQGFSFPTAWLVALATAVHPAFVFLATSTVMSECVFTLLALAGLRDGQPDDEHDGQSTNQRQPLDHVPYLLGAGCAAGFCGPHSWPRVPGTASRRATSIRKPRNVRKKGVIPT